MGLWRKLTLDWPCALGDALWWAFVATLKGPLERLTLRRALIFFTILLLVHVSLQLGTLDFDFIFVLGGDTVFYLEIVSAVMLVVARGHIRVAARAIVHKAREATRTAHVLVRHRLGTRQRRSPRRRKLPPKSSDNEPAAIGWAFA